jgi:hypothetical protein
MTNIPAKNRLSMGTNVVTAKKGPPPASLNSSYALEKISLRDTMEIQHIATGKTYIIRNQIT